MSIESDQNKEAQLAAAIDNITKFTDIIVTMSKENTILKAILSEFEEKQQGFNSMCVNKMSEFCALNQEYKQQKYDLEQEYEQRKQKLDYQDQELTNRKQELDQLKQELDQHKLNQQRLELIQQKQELDQQQQKIDQHQQKINHQQQELDLRTQKLDQRAQQLDKKACELNEQLKHNEYICKRTTQQTHVEYAHTMRDLEHEKRDCKEYVKRQLDCLHQKKQEFEEYCKRQSDILDNLPQYLIKIKQEHEQIKHIIDQHAQPSTNDQTQQKIE